MTDSRVHLVVTEQGVFQPPIYIHWIQPEGLLPNGEMFKYSAAAAYFTHVAHKVLKEVPEQVTYEDETDLTVSLRKILDGIITMYAIDDVDKMMNLMPLCRQQAYRETKSWNPRFQLWLDTGGQKQDSVTREESALTQIMDD